MFIRKEKEIIGVTVYTQIWDNAVIIMYKAVLQAICRACKLKYRIASVNYIDVMTLMTLTQLTGAVASYLRSCLVLARLLLL